MTHQPAKSNIPHFKNYQEEAAFWDSHDFTEFVDELKPVQVWFAKNLSNGVTVRFSPKDLNHIRQTAKEKGMGATTLIRMWVLERLRTPAKPQLI